VYGKQIDTQMVRTLTYETVDKKNAQEGCTTSLEIFDFMRDISFDSHGLLKMPFP
jgi:hypothetical protein